MKHNTIVLRQVSSAKKKLVKKKEWGSRKQILSSINQSRAVSNFYVTEFEIWAGFGLVGSTEQKLGPIMSNF